ncbi:lysophospholipid acyltransferase family protein [Paenibacillus sp. CN-4]|uniref:lysophospholipid acyltransferase family protein n=1 Tax=Paenibacillus nanchangensis TaxID=3348343 RepID=UPI003979796C
MLAAAKSRTFDNLFYLYNSRYLLQRNFRYVGAAGDLSPDEAAGRPILYVMNHSSWWDGLLAYHAARTLTQRDHYFMMEEAQLKKYAFFRKIGAYSIDRHRSSSTAASLKYTASLLKGGGSVWMFPEGEIRRLGAAPLEFQSGAGFVLRLCPEAAVVPVTLVHGLFLHSKPEAVLLAGPPILKPWSELDRKTIAEMLQSALQTQLDGHLHEVRQSENGLPAGCTPLIRTGQSVNERYDAFRLRRAK